MSRNLDSTLSSSLTDKTVYPIVLVMLTFRSQVSYIWTGTGTLVWNGMSFLGVGSLGKLSDIVEGTAVKADGATVSLSGIDPTLQAECMADIQLGAPAKIWYGHFANGQVLGSPYLIFSGQVDKPSFTIGAEAISIQLALESRMSNHARPSSRRYTSADQRISFPTDISMSWVEQLSDQALIWGE